MKKNLFMFSGTEMIINWFAAMKKQEVQKMIVKSAIKFKRTRKSDYAALSIASGFMKSVFMNNVL